VVNPWLPGEGVALRGALNDVEDVDWASDDFPMLPAASAGPRELVFGNTVCVAYQLSHAAAGFVKTARPSALD